MALLLATACLAAGCVTTTMEVRVVDPAQVSVGVPHLDGICDVTPLPHRPVVIDSDELVDGGQTRPYSVVTARDDSGALRLDCNGCTDGISTNVLVDAGGKLRSTEGPALVTPDRLIVWQHVCFVRIHRGSPCTVFEWAALSTPWSNVARAEADTHPASRVIGGVIAGHSSLFAAMGSVLLAAGGGGHADPVFTAGGGILVGIGALGMLGGLVYALLPAKHRPLHP